MRVSKKIFCAINWQIYALPLYVSRKTSPKVQLLAFGDALAAILKTIACEPVFCEESRKKEAESSLGNGQLFS